MPFRSAGISGYVGKRNMIGRKRKVNRRFMKRKRKFQRKIVNVVDKRMLQKSVYTILRPKQCIAAVNTPSAQDYRTLAIMNSGTDIALIRARIGAALGITSNADTCEFNVDSYILKIAAKNQEQTNCVMDLYECVPRISTQIDPATHLTNVATNTGGTGASTIAYWGATPYQYPAWCEAFKILRKVRYLLAPGATELIEIRETKRRRIDVSRYYLINGTAATGDQQDPRISKFWLAICYGEPTNDSVTKTNVTSSSFKVDFVTREDYHYSYSVASLNPDNTASNNLTAITNNESSTLVDTGASVVPPAQS